MIIFILSVFPKLIKTCASNDKCGIDLDSIWSECWILKELLEAFQIPLNSHIGQIRHHMRDYLIRAIFRQGEGLLDGLNSMSSVGISCYIFIDALYSDLQSCAAIRE